MAEILRTPQEFQQATLQWRRSGLSVGFVPTLGALHRGHRSLLERARAESDRVALSIFLNPTQFDQAKDIATYPQTVESDLAMAREAGVDAVFFPESPGQMYIDDYRYRIVENRESQILCGQHRAGHFDGVLTVVLKLLLLASADRAYFGEKDFQQLELVRGMTSAFFIPTEIIACPTVRDEDGLALSSRNQRLSKESRARAAEFPRILREASSAEIANGELQAAGFQVDYVEDWKGRRLAAVHIDGVRLIDNVPV